MAPDAIARSRFWNTTASANRLKKPGSNAHHTIGVLLCVMAVSAVSLWRFLPIGAAFLFVVMVLALLVSVVVGTDNRDNQYVIAATIAFMVYISLLSLAYPPENLFDFLIPIGLLGTFLAFNSVAPNVASLRAFIIQMSVVAKVVIVVGFVYQITSAEYIYYKTNVQLLLLFFIFVNARVHFLTKTVFVGLWVYQAFVSSDRAPIVALGVVLVAWVLWKVACRRRAIAAVFFALVLGAIAAVPVVFARHYFSSNFVNVGDPMSGYSGSFLSARELIWGTMLEIAAEKGLAFGGGLGLQPLDSGFTFSYHSTVISILARTGIVGLILFLLVIYALLLKYSRYLNNPTVRWSGAFTIGLLVMHISEIGFIEDPAQSIMTWLILAFGSISIHALNRTSTGSLPAGSSIWASEIALGDEVYGEAFPAYPSTVKQSRQQGE